MSAPWTAADIPDQTGRTIVITGATSGLGLESARALAPKGARLLLAARNPAKAEGVRAEVARLATGPEPVVVEMDLADLTSVRAAAEEIRERAPQLDVLLNNAGVMAPPLARTAQGFELQLGTNHLGPFALTGLVLPSLLAAEVPRVVTVASNAHKGGRMRWSDLHWQRRYQRWPAYAQSKLANLLFTFELDRRAHAADVWLVAVAAHPGYSATHLVEGSIGASRAKRAFFGLGERLWSQSAADGAWPQLYAATMDDVGSADYYGPDGRFELTGSPTRTKARPSAEDRADAARLWEISERLTGVTYPWPAPAG